MTDVRKQRLDEWDIDILKHIRKGINRIYQIYKALHRQLETSTIAGKLDRLEKLRLIRRRHLHHELTQWGMFCLSNYPKLMRFIRSYVKKGDSIPYEKVAGKFGLSAEYAIEFVRLFEQVDFGEIIPQARGHSIESKYVRFKEFIYGCEEADKPRIIDLGTLGMRLICIDCGYAIPFSPEGNPTVTCDNPDCGARYIKKEKFVPPILISIRDVRVRRREERFPIYREVRKALGLKTPRQNYYQLAKLIRERFGLSPLCLSSTDH